MKCLKMSKLVQEGLPFRPHSTRQMMRVKLHLMPKSVSYGKLTRGLAHVHGQCVCACVRACVCVCVCDSAPTDGGYTVHRPRERRGNAIAGQASRQDRSPRYPRTGCRPGGSRRQCSMRCLPLPRAPRRGRRARGGTAQIEQLCPPVLFRLGLESYVTSTRVLMIQEANATSADPL
jgi:hypothetical protein